MKPITMHYTKDEEAYDHRQRYHIEPSRRIVFLARSTDMCHPPVGFRLETPLVGLILRGVCFWCALIEIEELDFKLKGRIGRNWVLCFGAIGVLYQERG